MMAVLIRAETVCEYCGTEGDPLAIAYCCLSGD